MQSLQKIRSFFEENKKNPHLFYDKVLGCSYWDKQKEITDAVFKYPRVSVKSANGVGKSYITARIALNFLYSFPQDCAVITVAPTFRQVENILWREIHSAYNTSLLPLGGRLLKTQIDIDDKWYAIGVASDKPGNVQGIRAGNLLIIVDEADECDPKILDALEGNRSGGNTRLVYIGNPINISGRFYESFKSEFFHKISISAFDVPNFSSNGIHCVEDLKKFSEDEINALPSSHPYLTTPQWAWYKMHDWGEDSPIFKSRILAEFPSQSENALLSYEWLEKSISSEDKTREGHQKISIGVDVARSTGGDETVITVIKSGNVIDIKGMQTRDTMVVVGACVEMAGRHGFNKIGDVFCVDDIGCGGGVNDRLQEMKYDCISGSFSDASSSSTDKRFLNKKMSMFWNLRTAFKDGEIKIIDKGKLVKHLCILKEKYRSDGKLMMQPKKEMEDSPDYADSLCYAWHGYCSGGQNSVLSSNIETVNDEIWGGENNSMY